MTATTPDREGVYPPPNKPVQPTVRAASYLGSAPRSRAAGYPTKRVIVKPNRHSKIAKLPHRCFVAVSTLPTILLWGVFVLARPPSPRM